MIKLVINGPPRTKKNSGRIVRNRATGAPMFLPSASSKHWEGSATYQLMNQWRRAALTVPVRVAATFYREKATGDLVNYMQAVADALEVAKVIEDDKLIVSWDGTRLDKDAERPRVELELSTIDESLELPLPAPPPEKFDMLDPALVARWKARGK